MQSSFLVHTKVDEVFELRIHIRDDYWKVMLPAVYGSIRQLLKIKEAKTAKPLKSLRYNW